MSEYMRALAEHYRQAGGVGASADAYCYECGRTLGPLNRRRGGYCERCESESDDGLSRDGAASEPRKGSLYAQSLLNDGASLGLPVAPSGQPSGLTKTGGALNPRR